MAKEYKSGLQAKDERKIEREIRIERHRRYARRVILGRWGALWQSCLPLIGPSLASAAVLGVVSYFYSNHFVPWRENGERADRLKAEILVRVERASAELDRWPANADEQDPARNAIGAIVDGGGRITTSPEFKGQGMFSLLWELRRLTSSTALDPAIKLMKGPPIEGSRLAPERIRTMLECIESSVHNL